MMYTVVTTDHHYTGGTGKGISYLTSHAHLPFSFMGWINEGYDALKQLIVIVLSYINFRAGMQ